MNSLMNSYTWIHWWIHTHEFWYMISQYSYSRQIHENEFISEFILWIPSHIWSHDHEFICNISWFMNSYMNSCISRISWNHTWNHVYRLQMSVGRPPANLKKRRGFKFAAALITTTVRERHPRSHYKGATGHTTRAANLKPRPCPPRTTGRRPQCPSPHWRRTRLTRPRNTELCRKAGANETAWLCSGCRGPSLRDWEAGSASLLLSVTTLNRKLDLSSLWPRLQPKPGPRQVLTKEPSSSLCPAGPGSTCTETTAQPVSCFWHGRGGRGPRFHRAAGDLLKQALQYKRNYFACDPWGLETTALHLQSSASPLFNHISWRESRCFSRKWQHSGICVPKDCM